MMNRNQEYRELLVRLGETPPELEHTVTRARARKKARKRRLGLSLPLGSLTLIVCAFVLIVNSSTAMAYAVGQVPLLGSLAKAVAFSPSLRAAVENQYVQPVGEDFSGSGYTLTVEYIIVDRKQVNIFYSLSGGTGELTAWVRMQEDADVHGFGLSNNSFVEEGLRKVTLDFIQEDVPPSLALEALVRADRGTETAPAVPVGEAPPPEERGETVIPFTVSFDPAFTEVGEDILIGRWIDLDGQRIFVKSAEVYPTHFRLHLEDDPDNTAWLVGLDFHIRNADGSLTEKGSNGITASGSDTPFYATYMLDSNYFTDGDFTLCFTGAAWLDKTDNQVVFDLAKGEADWLPPGVTLTGVASNSSGWSVELDIPLEEGEPLHSLFSWTYHDTEGNEHHINRSSASYKDGGGGHVALYLDNYPLDTAVLSLQYTRRTTFDTPAEIRCTR